MRRLNRRYAAFLFAALVVLGIGTHFLHAYQVNRNAGAFIAQADRAEQAGQLAQAAEHLNRYLSIHKDDPDALARYGLVLAKLARNAKGRTEAFLVLDKALKLNPSRQDVGRQVVILALQIGRPSDAIEHATALVASDTKNADLLNLLAECQEAGGKFEDARITYLAAIEQAPDRLESYLSLARLLRRRLKQPGPADAQIEAMLAHNKETVRAWLLASAYYREFANEPKFNQCIDRAYAVAPDDAEVLLIKAIGITKKIDEGGRKYMERGIQLHPKDARFYVALAEVELRGNHRPEAIRRLHECLEKTPADASVSWNVADLLLDAGERAEASNIIAKLRARNYLASQVAYLEGRALVQKGAWRQASERFEHLIPALLDTPVLAKRSNYYLGQCYEQLGNPDQALIAYGRATAVDPLWIAPRAGTASASLTLGKIDAALAEYRAIQGDVPESKLPLARLLVLRNLGRPINERDWSEAETVLRDAEKALPDSIEVPILRAEILVGRNQAADAEKLLDGVAAEQKKHAQYWVARAGLAERLQQPEKALKLLDEADSTLGPTVEVQLARARHWGSSPGPAADEGLAKIEKSLGDSPPADQARLRTALAEAQFRLGRPAVAKRLWTQVAESEGRENSLYIRLLLFDLELKDGDDAALRRLIDQIHGIEGDEGALWRYGEASRLIRHAKRGDASLDEARGYLSEVTKFRPGWSRVPLLEAAIAEIEGNAEEVIRSSMAAVNLGDRRPETVRRVVQLLYERRRYAEADQIIRQLPEQTPISGDLMRLAAEISIRKNDSQGALDWAQKAISDDSHDYRDQVWLGTILGAAGRNEDAEKHFRQATKLGAKNPDSWIALVQFLARTGQVDKAAPVLQDAEAGLPSNERALALAQCYEALGRADRADALYREALKEQPDAAAALRVVADYHLRQGRPQEAEPQLRRLLEPAVRATPAEAAWARRSLAFSLATGAKSQDLAQALALLDENGRDGRESDEDSRARAIVLTLRPGRHPEAIRLFEDLGRRLPLTPDEQFLLAKLYLAEGDWRSARQRFLGLVSGPNPKPMFLSHYIDAILQHGDPRETQFWMAKLEALEPTAPTTIQLKVRALYKLEKTDAALAAVREYAATKDAMPALVADLLGGLGDPAAAEAEAAYRRLLAGSVQPDIALRFAGFLAQQHRVDEALQWCERVWQKAPGPVARQTAGVIRAGRGSPEQVRRVEEWVARDLARKPTVDMLLALADMHDYQGRSAEAVSEYRAVLNLDDHNSEALNNLAWLLAVKLNQAPEALALIDRALEAVGSAATLLDTRAVIYMRLGRPEPALKDLDRVISLAPTPTAYFHQAQAFMAASNRRAASDAMKTAQKMKLQASDLHPAELTAYHRLLADIGERQ